MSSRRFSSGGPCPCPRSSSPAGEASCRRAPARSGGHFPNSPCRPPTPSRRRRRGGLARTRRPTRPQARPRRLAAGPGRRHPPRHRLRRISRWTSTTGSSQCRAAGSRSRPASHRRPAAMLHRGRRSQPPRSNWRRRPSQSRSSRRLSQSRPSRQSPRPRRCRKSPPRRRCRKSRHRHRHRHQRPPRHRHRHRPPPQRRGRHGRRRRRRCRCQSRRRRFRRGP